MKSEVNPIEIADHELISVCINIKKTKRETIYKTFRCMKNYNQETFCNGILDEVQQLNSILNTDDVNIQLDIFNTVFLKCLNNYAPIVTRAIGRPHAPWMTDEIRSEIECRNLLQKRLKKDRSNLTLQNEYKQIKRNTKLLIRNSKSNYYKEKFKSSNSKETWRLVNELG